jgi:archaellum component FlaC
MSDVSVATREDIEDVLQVLDTMMTRIDDRFTKVEGDMAKQQRKIQSILNHLDSILTGRDQRLLRDI